MRFKTLLLLVSATLVGFVTFAEAGCTQSKTSEEERFNEKGRRAVEYANRQTNPLEALNKPASFVSNDGQRMTIECVKGQSLSDELLVWVRYLVDRDSESLGNKLAGMGYTPEERWNTYLHDATYLLIVRSSSNEPVGLAHFRFQMDPTDTIEIVYLWELLVEETMRGHGIGTYLLNTIMELTKHFNMREIMLSVFKSNRRAISLYTKFGFNVADIQPEQDLFWILSIPNPQFHE